MLRNVLIGFKLGTKQIQRTNPWTSLLIILVIALTLINLVIISGILNGIIDGVVRTVRKEAVGDITIDPLPEEGRIKETERLLRELGTIKEIEAFSPRFEEIATIEANYKNRYDLSSEPDIIATNITGIDPKMENETVGLGSLLIEGEYLNQDDRDYVLIGKHYIDRYAEEYGNAFDSLKNISPGDKVRINYGENSKEFTVKGIVFSKIDMVSLSVYIHENDFRRMFNRIDNNANQIVVKLKSEEDIDTVEKILNDNEFNKISKISSFSSNIPKYMRDVMDTFTLLSTTISVIGVIVASITVFIILFINIISKRRQIGILKAIGIKRQAIRWSYVTQAAIYALVGLFLGIIIIFSIAVPYLEKNPIDFPYTDVTLSVTFIGIAIRCFIIFLIMLISGYIPAYLITRQNTLNSILGRK